MNTKTGAQPMPVLDLLEAAFHLLRLAPRRALAWYGLGTLPFLLALLFFWSDMARGAYAEARLAPGAALLALLFIWMKTWQAVYAAELLSCLRGDPPPPLGLRHLARVALGQGILQPTGFLVLPLGLLLTLPFGWWFATYQNLTVLGPEMPGNLRELLGKAWKQARLWPAQNHGLLAALLPYTLAVFVNIIGTMVFIPKLLRMFLGLETPFTTSLAAMTNTTFLATAGALTYLCVDPLLKAAYALRCFHGQSLQTGQDLRGELRRFTELAKSAALLLALGWLPFKAIGAPAEPAPRASAENRTAAPVKSTAISPTDLDHTITQVLERREFAWRLPRERLPKPKEQTGWLARQLEQLGKSLTGIAETAADWLRKLDRWLSRGSRGSRDETSGWSVGPGLRWLLIGLAGVLAGLVILMVFRLWQRRRLHQPTEAEAISARPDLTQDDVAADQLPEDEWMQMARSLTGKGELRLALRAFYLASLAALNGQNLIRVARFKSNRDYERELARRAHAVPETVALFAGNVAVFDRVWYGLHEVTEESVTAFERNVEKLRRAASPSPAPGGTTA